MLNFASAFRGRVLIYHRYPVPEAVQHAAYHHEFVAAEASPRHTSGLKLFNASPPTIPSPLKPAHPRRARNTQAQALRLGNLTKLSGRYVHLTYKSYVI